MINKVLQIGFVLLVALVFSSCRSTLNDAEAAVSMKQWDLAISLYETAQAEDPGDATIPVRLENAKRQAALDHFDRGERAVRRNRYDLAIREFEQALRFEAREEYREAIERAKRGQVSYTYQKHLDNGKAKLAARELSEAKTHFESAKRLLPESEEPDRQIERIEELMRQARSHYQEAVSWQEERAWDKAVACFDRALSCWSSYSEARTRRRECANRLAYETLFAKGEKLEAEAALDPALQAFVEAEACVSTPEVRAKITKVRGHLHDEWLRKGDALKDRRCWEEALDCYERATGYENTSEVRERMRQASYGGWLEKGAHYESAERYAEAFEAYGKAQSFERTAEVAQRIESLRSRIRADLRRFVRARIAYPFLERDRFFTACAHLCGQRLMKKRHHLVSLKVRNKAAIGWDGLVARVQLEGYSQPASRTFSLEAGESKTIELTPSFTDALSTLGEQRPGSILVSLEGPDGSTIFESTKRVVLLSRNETPRSQAAAFMLPVFITPNDRRVEQLVTHAAEKTATRSMAGYQKPREGVLDEVRAIYETIAALDVHYRSSAVSFLDEEERKAQRTYFPAESLAGTGASCLDASLLFASAFENIGLDTCLCLVPGHVLVSVFLKKGDTRAECPIETTMVGQASFQDAVRAGSETLRQHRAAGTLQILRVDALRKAGVKPYPYPIDVGKFSVGKKLKRDNRRSFVIRLKSLRLSPRDYPAARRHPGRAPEIFLTVSVNGRKILDTSEWIAKDSWSVSWTRRGLRARFPFSRNDVLKLEVRDKDRSGSRLVLRFEQDWHAVIGSPSSLSTRNGTRLEFEIERAR